MALQCVNRRIDMITVNVYERHMRKLSIVIKCFLLLCVHGNWSLFDKERYNISRNDVGALDQQNVVVVCLYVL